MDFTQTKELLHDSAYFYVISVSMEGRYSYVNNHYDSVFSKLHGSILNKPYEITMHPDDTNICKEVATKCFSSPNQAFPATIRKHDGKADISSRNGSTGLYLMKITTRREYSASVTT